MLDMAAAALAAQRFGFGPRPNELRAIAGDPRGWVKSQLGATAALPAQIAALPPAEDDLLAFGRWQLARRLIRTDNQSQRGSQIHADEGPHPEDALPKTFAGRKSARTLHPVHVSLALEFIDGAPSGHARDLEFTGQLRLTWKRKPLRVVSTQKPVFQGGFYQWVLRHSSSRTGRSNKILNQKRRARARRAAQAGREKCQGGTSGQEHLFRTRHVLHPLSQVTTENEGPHRRARISFRHSESRLHRSSGQLNLFVYSVHAPARAPRV